MVNLNYREIRELNKNHYLRRYEIPVEHSVSFPIPTIRWGKPAYAFFAAPALRLPGKPFKQGLPDRWWLINANNGHLLLYSLVTIYSFGETDSWKEAEIQPTKRSLSEQKALLAEFDDQMTSASNKFFERQTNLMENNHVLRETLNKLMPVSIMDHYKALAPDFFDWLGI